MLTRFRTWHTYTLTLSLFVIVLHVMANSEMLRVDESYVEVHPLGSAERALTRIQQQSFTTVGRLNALAADPTVDRNARLAYTYAPLLRDQPGLLSGDGATPLGVYYTISSLTTGDDTVTTINYFLYLSYEAGGKPLQIRMSRYGRPFDAELLYRIKLINGRVFTAYYQAPIHRMVRFDYPIGGHPIFAIASDNNNFQLVSGDSGTVLAPLPQPELSADPFHDPDYLALAGEQARLLDGVDISQYVYVFFHCVDCQGPIDVSVLVSDRWYHVHDVLPASLLGESVTVPGYYQAGIHVDSTPLPGDIRELRIVTANTRPVSIQILSVYIHPKLRVAS